MKTLDQVEARIPIDPHKQGFSLPYAISQAGSYYLTDNVTASGGTAGIVITSDDVTIDLNGFSLVGGGSGSVAGIDVVSAIHQNQCVRNGTVRGWTKGGVRLINSRNCRLEKLLVSDNTGDAGISVSQYSIIADCAAYNNATYGIYLAGTSNVVTHCVSSGNETGFWANDHAVFSDCTATLNKGVGISADRSVIVRCTVAGNQGIGISGISVFSSSTVKDCTVTENKGDGIHAGAGNLIEGNNCASNGAGIVAGDGSTVINCTSQSNATDGIHVGQSCIVTHCSSTKNGTGTTGAGILTDIRASISGCTAIGNKGDGIVFSGDSLVSNNHASTNGGAGFHDVGSASRIDGNVSRENTGTGILASTGDTVVRNNSGANGNGAANNQYGPTVGANWGPVGTANTATSPWTNF
jgi:parallel beta-helix repeat protein